MNRVMETLARRIAAGVIALPLLGGSAGCLVTHNSNHSRTGNYVSDATLNQIEPGKTTVGWVRATLGPPTVIQKLQDGTQIWKYNYTERQDSSGTVFIFFAGNDVKETAGTVFIEFKDDVVRRTWRS